MARDGVQAVVWQTAINPVVAMELLAAGAWQRRRRARARRRSTPSRSSTCSPSTAARTRWRSGIPRTRCARARSLERHGDRPQRPHGLRQRIDPGHRARDRRPARAQRRRTRSSTGATRRASTPSSTSSAPSCPARRSAASAPTSRRADGAARAVRRAARRRHPRQQPRHLRPDAGARGRRRHLAALLGGQRPVRRSGSRAATCRGCATAAGAASSSWRATRRS